MQELYYFFGNKVKKMMNNKKGHRGVPSKSSLPNVLFAALPHVEYFEDSVPIGEEAANHGVLEENVVGKFVKETSTF